MAMTVWKFPLQIVDFQEVEMSASAKILKVEEQHGNLCLWAWTNDHPEAPKVNRRFAIVGTGNPAPPFGEAEHIGSVLTYDGDLVWHVFELRRP